MIPAAFKTGWLGSFAGCLKGSKGSGLHNGMFSCFLSALNSLLNCRGTISKPPTGK